MLAWTAVAVAVALAASGSMAQTCTATLDCFDCTQTAGCSYCAPAAGSPSSAACHATADTAWWTASCSARGTDANDAKLDSGVDLSACPASGGCNGEECSDCINRYCTWCFEEVSCTSINSNSNCAFNSSSSCNVPCGARNGCGECLESSNCEWCAGASPDDGFTGSCGVAGTGQTCQATGYTCPVPEPNAASSVVVAPAAVAAAAAAAALN